MQKPLKYLRILLTLMTGCPEYKYWEADNDELELDDRILPTWTGAIDALEALNNKIEELHPELFNIGGRDEQTDKNEVADPRITGAEGSEEAEGGDE